MDLERLSAVCATLLDNADFDVGLDSGTATVTLDFTVGGSLERVVFRCSRFWRFGYAKAGDDAQGVFVGETRVSVIEGREAVRQELKEDWRCLGERTPSRLFRVATEGGAMINILCEGLKWQVERPS